VVRFLAVANMCHLEGPNRLWGSPNLLFCGYRRLLPRVWSVRKHEADLSHPSGARRKHKWSYTSTFLSYVYSDDFVRTFRAL